jgi:predicted GNAT family N-acyltransferase
MEAASTIVQVSDYAEAATSIHAIRSQVFQFEQGVDSALDFDGLDPAATHFLAFWEQTAVGTARIRDLEHQLVKLERLAVLPTFRSRGIGKHMVAAIEHFLVNRNSPVIVLHAQQQTIPFYEKLGFKIVGDCFLLD